MDVCATASTIKYLSRKDELTQPGDYATDNSADMQHGVDTGYVTENASLGATPGNSVYEMSGWGAFDSMVSLFPS